jgi:hypothetical protein
VVPGVTLEPTTSSSVVQQILDQAFADLKVSSSLQSKGPLPPGFLIKLLAAIVPVIVADLASGKTVAQIVPDVIAAILKALAN